MTAAVYGTDPQTGQSTGVRMEEVLRFRQGAAGPTKRRV